MNWHKPVLSTPASSSLQVKDHPISSLEKKRKRLPEPSTEQRTCLLPMEHSIASSPEVQRFVRAVQKSDMMSAWSVFIRGISEVKKRSNKHLITLHSYELAEPINSAREDHIKKWISQVLLVHAEQSFIDNVFEASNLLNGILREDANGAELACLPHRFTHLLCRIDDKREQ